MKFLATVLLMAIAASAATAATRGRRTLSGDPQTISRTKAQRANATPHALPIINDDYEKARAEANKRNLPLFVEVWAPW